MVCWGQTCSRLARYKQPDSEVPATMAAALARHHVPGATSQGAHPEQSRTRRITAAPQGMRNRE